jgi:ssDNA-binding replication factor A large subunit
MVEIMKVSELQPGMRKVDVTVKIVEIGSIREVFVKTDQKKHQVVDMTVGDETGIISMSVWDELIHQLKQNDIIQIISGYTSEFGGVMKLNIGKFGQWKRLESDEFDIEVASEEIPGVGHKKPASGPVQPIKVIDCYRKKAGINLIVKVADRLPERKATTKDGMSHDINRFLVGDETACINFVLWDKGDDIQKDDILEIQGGYTREFNKTLELNLSRTGNYTKSDADVLDVNLDRNLSKPG